MPTALEKIQAGADKAGKKLAAKGLREHGVTLRIVQDLGKAALLGKKGTAAATTNDDLALDPPPRLRNVSAGYVARSEGVIEMGDVFVDRISRDAAYAARLQDPRTVFVVTGPSHAGLYTIVGGTLKMERSQWTAVLRRRAP